MTQAIYPCKIGF